MLMLTQDFFNFVPSSAILPSLNKKDAGGILTLDDLANYKVIKRKVLVDEIGDLKIYTLPIPTGGPVVTEIINILKGKLPGI